MVQIFKSSPVVMKRIEKKRNNPKVIKGIYWISENTSQDSQWGPILLLSHLMNVDKDYIANKIRQLRDA